MADTKMDIIISLKDRVSKGFKNVGSALDGVRKRVDTLKGSIFNLRNAFLGLGLGLIVKDVIETKNQFVKFQKTLETLEGSAEKAAKKWQELLEFAEITPYRINEVVKSYKTLKAFGLDPTIETMRILGDTASALGGPDVLGRVALVLGQIQAQGFMSAQDMNQLANAGINAAKVMKEAFGVTRNEVMSLRKQGVEAHTIINLLLDTMKNQFGGQMAAMNKELSGQWEMLISIWQRFEIAIMDSGVYTYLTSMLTLLNQKILELRTEGKLDEWAETISKKVISAFKKMAFGVASVYDTLAPILKSFKDLFLDVWDWFSELPPAVQKVGIVGYMLAGSAGTKVLVLGIMDMSAKVDDLFQHLKAGPKGFKVKTIEDKLNRLKASLKDMPDWAAFGVASEFSRTTEEIEKLENELVKLIGKKIVPLADSEDVEKNAESMVGIVSAAFAKIEAKAAETQKKTRDVIKPKEAEGIAPVKPDVLSANQIEAETEKLISNIKTQLVELDFLYEQGSVKFQEYWDTRRLKLEEQFKLETDTLKKLAEASVTDPKKKLQYETELHLAKQQFLQDEMALKAEEATAAEDVMNKKIELENIFKELKIRLMEESFWNLEAQHAAELLALDQRHEEERLRIEEMTQFIGDEEKKRTLLKDLEAKQQIETEKKVAKQTLETWNQRFEAIGKVTGGLKDIFTDLYEMGGKSNKKMFKIAKAAAYATAVVNGAAAVTKALMEGGPIMGPIMAAIIAAKTGIEIVKIKGTEMGGSFAEGGQIPGYSSHSKADNIKINATAGEFMQPVKSVKYYGKNIMEAMRKQLIPRQLFEGFAGGGLSPKLAYSHAADGGVIQKSNEAIAAPKIEIINVTNPEVIKGLALDAVHEDRDVVVNMVLNEMEERNIKIGRAI